jgi:F-type H+-transporting ATPase subunit delta
MSRSEGYAAAFLEVAKAEGALATVEGELLGFARALESSPDLQKVLTDQAIPAERRQGIVEDLLPNAHPVTANLVSMVVGSGRAKDLPTIVSSLLDQAAAEVGKVSGEVRSAVPLNADQMQRLTTAIEKSTGKQVDLHFLVDPSLIGGIVTRVGDTIIDGSLRTRLERVREAL